MYAMANPNSTSLYPKMEEITTFDLRDYNIKARPELLESIPRQDVPGQRNERNDNHLGAHELEEVENLAVSDHVAAVVDDADGAAVGAVGVDDDQYLRTEGEYNIGETDFRQDVLNNCVDWKPAKNKDRAVRFTEEIKRKKRIRQNIKVLKDCLKPEGLTKEIRDKLSDGLEKWYYYSVKLQGKDLEKAERFGKLCQLKGWISKDVLREFCLILDEDKCNTSCKTTVDNDYLIELFKNEETVLPRYINLILMVGRVGNKLIISDRKSSPPGKHFVFVHLELEKKEAYYCDSLGWITPKDLHEYLIDFTKFKDIKEIQIKLMHEPSSFKLNTRHVCNDLCRNFCLQTCDNVCGLVVMYCSALSALYRGLIIRGK